ncbi:hypothetical protein B0H10DRAFT_1116922 [Mycena sp. CBHHK59/15]|nr:hypothetical protein B0H10DRAFT_1116922 [Mycena sp. CBHHK59/15]
MNHRNAHWLTGNATSERIEDPSYPLETRIPIDILELIFEAGARQAHRPIHPWPRQIEIAVSHVNKRWREVAINLAVLWSFIRASPSEPHDKLATYFERSKGHALRVCLFAYRGFWKPDIVAAMRPHLHRIRRFHLITDFIESMSKSCCLDSSAPFCSRRSIVVIGSTQRSLARFITAAFLWDLPTLSRRGTLSFPFQFNMPDSPVLHVAC